MNRIIDALERTDQIVLFMLKAITITCFAFLTILISANVFVRFFPIASLHWFDEIIEMLYAYLIFYGAAALWITREHFSVGNWIAGRVIRDVTMKHCFQLFLEVLTLGFVVVFFCYSLRLTMLAHDVTNAFAIPKGVLYSCLPVSGAIMMLSSIKHILMEIAGMTEKVGVE